MLPIRTALNIVYGQIEKKKIEFAYKLFQFRKQSICVFQYASIFSEIYRNDFVKSYFPNS